MKTYPAKTYQQIKQEAVDALVTAYSEPYGIGQDGQATVSRQWEMQREAIPLVDAALAEGIPVGQLALQAHLPAILVIKLVSDPAQRRDAYEVEIHRLQQAIRQVEIQRGSDINARWREGETKQALADEFGTTRVTLDAWIELGKG